MRIIWYGGKVVQSDVPTAYAFDTGYSFENCSDSAGWRRIEVVNGNLSPTPEGYVGYLGVGTVNL